MPLTVNKQIHELTELDTLQTDAYVHVNLDQVDYRQPVFKFTNGIVTQNSVNNVISNFPNVVEDNISVSEDMLDQALSDTITGLEEAQQEIDEKLEELNTTTIPAVDMLLNQSLTDVINTVETASNVFGESFNRIESNSLVLSLDQERAAREQDIAELNERIDGLNDATLPALEDAVNKLEEDFAALESEVVVIDTQLNTNTDDIIDLTLGLTSTNDNLDEITTIVGDTNSGLVKQVDDLTFIVSDPSTGLEGRVTIVEGDVTDLESGVSANSSAIDAISIVVNDVDDGVIANANKITALNNQITDPEIGLAASADAIDNLETEVSSLDGQVKAQAGQATKLSVSIGAPSIAEGVSDVFGDKDNQVALNAEISRVDKVVADSEGNTAAISDLQLEVNNLEGDVAQTNLTLVALNDEVEGVTASVAELGTSLNTTNGAVVQSSLEISSVQDDVTGLTEANAQLSARIGTVEDESLTASSQLIVDVREDVTGLQGETTTLLARAYLGTEVDSGDGETYVSGIDFENNGTFSQVRIKADDFLLANSAGVPQLKYTSAEDTFDFLGIVRADQVIIGESGQGLQAPVVSALEINGDQITANTIFGDRIVANAITTEKISSDAITSDLIKAGVVTAKHLVITSQNDAINDNTAFFDLDGWYVNALVDHDDNPVTSDEEEVVFSPTDLTKTYWNVRESTHPNVSGNEVYTQTGTNTNEGFLLSKEVPILAGSTYKLSTFTKSVGSPNLRLFVKFKDVDGNYITAAGNANEWLGSNTDEFFWQNPVTNGSDWTPQELVFGRNEYLASIANEDKTALYWPIPDNAIEIQLGARGLRTGGNESRLIDYYIASMEAGNFVVQGSITGDKIDAKTVSADNIVANTISSDEIQANTITGTEIEADTITARHVKLNSSGYAVSDNPVFFTEDEIDKETDTVTNTLASGWVNLDTENGWSFNKDNAAPANGLVASQSYSVGFREFRSKNIPINRETIYRFSIQAKSTGVSTGKTNFYIQFRDATGAIISDNSLTGWQSPDTDKFYWVKPIGSTYDFIPPDKNQDVPTSWTRYQGIMGRDPNILASQPNPSEGYDGYPEIPAEAVTFDLVIRAFASNASSGTIYFQECYASEMFRGNLTVEGSITANEIKAESIDATRLVADAVLADVVAGTFADFQKLTVNEIALLPSEIGAETPTGAQDKANTAEANAINTADNNANTAAKDAGKVGGWSLNSSNIFTGSANDIVTSGYRTVDGINLNDNGSIHAKNFFLDANGDAGFKGDLEGARGTFSGDMTIEGSLYADSIRGDIVDVAIGSFTSKTLTTANTLASPKGLFEVQVAAQEDFARVLTVSQLEVDPDPANIGSMEGYMGIWETNGNVIPPNTDPVYKVKWFVNSNNEIDFALTDILVRPIPVSVDANPRGYSVGVYVTSWSNVNNEVIIDASDQLVQIFKQGGSITTTPL